MSDETTQAPPAPTGTRTSSRARRGRTLLAAAAVGAVVLAGAGGWFAGRAAATPEYDETTHRLVAEQLYGEVADWPDVGDWAHYRDQAFELCAQDELTFSLSLALIHDQGVDLDRTRLDVEFACPERVPEFWRALASNAALTPTP